MAPRQVAMTPPESDDGGSIPLVETGAAEDDAPLTLEDVALENVGDVFRGRKMSGDRVDLGVRQIFDALKMEHSTRVVKYVHASGEETHVHASDKVYKAFALDRARWDAANAAKRRVHWCHGKPGTLGLEFSNFTFFGCVLPPQGWLCCPQIYYATCARHRDADWPGDAGLVLTEKGIVGRNEQRYEWQAIAWDNLDVVDNVYVTRYDGPRCEWLPLEGLKVCGLPCAHKKIDRDNVFPWLDPLAGVAVFGLCLPCCGYVCCRPDAPGLYHLRIPSLGTETREDDGAPAAELNVYALAASADEVLAALRRPRAEWSTDDDAVGAAAAMERS